MKDLKLSEVTEILDDNKQVYRTEDGKKVIVVPLEEYEELVHDKGYKAFYEQIDWGHSMGKCQQRIGLEFFSEQEMVAAAKDLYVSWYGRDFPLLDGSDIDVIGNAYEDPHLLEVA